MSVAPSIHLFAQVEITGTTTRPSVRLPPLCRAFYDRAPAVTLRKYAPYLVAEVTAEGSTMKEAISDGFRQASSLCAPHSKYVAVVRKHPSQT